jgi:glutathione synthase
MTIRLGVVMDPIASIQYKKDATMSMLWEAAARGWEIYYFEQKDLYLHDSTPYGNARLMKVFRDENAWNEIVREENMPLADLDVILMRKDPPFNEEYIYTTYLLEHAERLGVYVVNRPQALRDCNEKLFTTFFPQCMPPTLVTQSIAKLHDFWHEHNDIVCKPLNSMGGSMVFRLKKDDVNANTIFDALTHHGTIYIVVQKFIPDIINGDKRIYMINGEPYSQSLARIPNENDWRGNIALGAKVVPQPLTDRDRFICSQVGPVLRDRGLVFVGLDVIGDYLTEINVTSPGAVREIDAALGINLSAKLFDVIEENIKG